MSQLEFDRFVPIWSGVERNRLRLISSGLGLLWGLLGLLILTVFGVIWHEFLGKRDSAYITFEVTMGMMFGAVYASESWRHNAKYFPLSRHDYIHLSITWGFRTVLLGILWGSIFTLSGLIRDNSILVNARWLGPSIFALLLQVVYVGIFSVVPAAILMAPITIFVWHKTLERLESQRRAFEEGE